jgi:hypothetical protein
VPVVVGVLVVVPVVDVDVVAGVVWELLVVLDLPPHPATTSVAESVASSVSMAASDVRFIGQPPVLARKLGGAHYQQRLPVAQADPGRTIASAAPRRAVR